MLIFTIAVLLFVGLELVFKKSVIGKIIVAALEDEDGVRCLGINVDKYFSLFFMMGCALAAIGCVLYAPISSIHPYMGLSVLLLAFAVVIVGGMGNIRGTFFSAFALCFGDDHGHRPGLQTHRHLNRLPGFDSSIYMR